MHHHWTPPAMKKTARNRVAQFQAGTLAQVQTSGTTNPHGSDLERPDGSDLQAADPSHVAEQRHLIVQTCAT